MWGARSSLLNVTAGMEQERSTQPGGEAVAPARLESPRPECGEEPQHPNPEVSRPPAPRRGCPALPDARTSPPARAPLLWGAPQKPQPARARPRPPPAPAAMPWLSLGRLSRGLPAGPEEVESRREAGELCFYKFWWEFCPSSSVHAVAAVPRPSP